MSFLYFDETIRERGEFIIGALVVSKADLSPVVEDRWRRLGLNPELDEYKSSDLKADNSLGVRQRQFVAALLQQSKLALTVLPVSDRKKLGEYCTELLVQLASEQIPADRSSQLILDQSITFCDEHADRLSKLGITVFPECDSRTVAGIQVADHAAHALGGMLLEEMGVIVKRVPAGESSGYGSDELLELGFELWASLRYALIGKNEYIEGLSPHPDDPANPFFRVDGVGLYVAPSCSEALARQARARFGINYLGCIH